MIYKSIELHNIEAVQTVPGHAGVRLQRVPEDVRLALNENAQLRMLQPTCGEIRFRIDGPAAEVVLSSESTTGVVIKQGDFEMGRCVVGKGEMRIPVTRYPHLENMPDSIRGKMTFDPTVFRLVLGGNNNQAVWLHGVEGDNVRPPAREQLPSRRHLAYGTSITQCYSATRADLGYAAQAAWRLGADIINLGVAGCAFCEPELADYIAGRTDWDFATLSLSVNMIGARFSLAEFAARVGYMVNAVTGADTTRPVFCITIFPCNCDPELARPRDTPPHPAEAYRQALRDAVAACPHPNVHLIEGPDILSDIRGLTEDLIHPSDNGHILMGQNLAWAIQGVLESDSESYHAH